MNIQHKRVLKMPDNVNQWVAFLNKLPPEIAGVLMSMFIAFLRVIYDREETKPMRVMLESLICGALSLTASYGILALQLNLNWAIFAGGVIGYIGSASVRTLAVRLINYKLSK